MIYKKDLLKRIETLETVKSFREETVVCDTCGCLLLEQHAQMVFQDTLWGSELKRGFVPYCLQHKKPYSKITCDLPFVVGRKNKFHYWDNLEVDEFGKPVKK